MNHSLMLRIADVLADLVCWLYRRWGRPMEMYEWEERKLEERRRRPLP